jgi:outer membrane protein assembly factor BamB
MFRLFSFLLLSALACWGCGPGGQGARMPAHRSSDRAGEEGGQRGPDGHRTNGDTGGPRLEPNVPFAMLGGGPRHLHRAPAPGPKTEPVETARFQCGGRIAASPVIGPDGTIYVGSIDGTFNALDRTGRLRWSYICDEPIFSTAAVSQTGKVFVGCDDDTLLAFSTDGTLRWTYRMKHDVDAAPVIAEDGVIYVGGEGLHAIDGEGRKRFKLWLGGHVTASPAVRPDGVIAVGSHDHRFYMVTPDGTVLGVFDTKGPIQGAAAVLSDNDMVFGSDDGYVYRLAKTGGMRWKFKTGGPVRAGIAVGREEKRLFAASMDGAVYCIDADVGQLVWKSETGRSVKASPMLDSDGRLYVGSRDHHLYAFDQEKGDVIWRIDLGFEIDAAVAVPGEGRLITADDNGVVRLFKEK